MKETGTADKTAKKQGHNTPDTVKKGTAKNSRDRHAAQNSIPAVHGSQPAFYDGSERMYRELQQSLQKTGDPKHPDTLKKEMDYKKTLGANDLMQYHDLKSGNYMPKAEGGKPHTANQPPKNPATDTVPNTAAEKGIMGKILDVITQQAKKSNTPDTASTAKEVTAKIKSETQPAINDTKATGQETNTQQTAAKDQSPIAEQPVLAPKPETAEIKKPAPKPTTEHYQHTLQPTTARNPETPVAAKAPVPDPVKAIPQVADNKPEVPVAATAQEHQTAQLKQEAAKTTAPQQNLQSRKEAIEKEAKVTVPETIGPVVSPRMDNALDMEGGEITTDPDTMLNITGLVAMAQEFRDQGQAAKTQAASQKGVIKALEDKIKGLEKEAAKSDHDLETVEKNIFLQENVVSLADKGLATSVTRQLKVEQEVGTYQQEYNKNKGKANDLNREAAGLLSGSKKNEDPAKADSGKLTRKLQELSSGANTIAQAITQSGNTTQKLSKEAQNAKVQNEKTRKENAESRKVLLQSKAKITSDKQKNVKAKAEIKQLTPELDKNEAEAVKLNQEGSALLLDSYVIEKEVIKTQDIYYKDMATVEGLKGLQRKETEKTEQAPATLSHGENLLVAFAQLATEETQIHFLTQLGDSDLELLKTKYDEFMASFDNSEADRQAQIEQNAIVAREGQIGTFDNKRKAALKKPMDLVTKNLSRVTGLKRIWMSVSLALSGVWNSITSISIVEIVKTLLYPSRWVQAIGDSIKGIWTDLSEWKGFLQDPVGMILNKATGIANKLLAITGVITGILGLLTVAATVGSIFTLGGMAPLAVWLGGATVTMGTVTFWIGAVALGLNILNGIKNIYDIHTAKTAEVMFKNTGELKNDIANSGMSVLAMIGGKSSIKGGNAVRNLAKTNPLTFGKRTFIGLKNSIKATAVSIPRRIGSVFKKETWVKGYQGFKDAYVKAKAWTKEKFTSKTRQNEPVISADIENKVDDIKTHKDVSKKPTFEEGPVVDITSDSFQDFYKSIKGIDGDIELAKQSYDLFKNQNWDDLEKLFKEKNLNGGWPPYDGFISKTSAKLEPGKILLDRYGGKTVDGKFVDSGTYFAKAGTDFEKRALPNSFLDKSKPVPLNTYEIIKDLPVYEGEAIPWFGQPGKGIQYQTPLGVDELIEKGYIKRLN